MSARMPAAFLGHGSPMNALDTNRFTEAWRAFGASVSPRPRAILAISAHWEMNAVAVTAMERPRTIHDFFGFPRALFDVQYPAPGSREVAEEVRDIVKPTHVGLDEETWGLDHGTWSVLVHAFPSADVPVVQLSLHAQRHMDFHVELGAKLAPLRERGVLIVASGNAVHNLRAIDWHQPELGFDWTQRFDDASREMLIETPSDAAALVEHADYARAHPSAEHFVPLLYLAGLAAAAREQAKVLVDGYAFGSLSMASYTLGAACPPAPSDGRPSARLADPKVAPPDDTNV